MGKRRLEGGGAAGWGRVVQKEEVQQDGEGTIRRMRYSKIGKRQSAGGGTLPSSRMRNRRSEGAGIAGWGREDQKEEEVQQNGEETI